ncbi:MAG: DUF4373 domain-containing protein [Oscillospiraceae bacterium]
MPRPKKKGLDYFPLDVDIFENDKLFDVQNDYGPLGEVIYIRLLCLVYKNGYYYKFESLDKLAAMIIRSIGNRWTRDKKTVKEIILYLAKINLFSAELMQRNVITSRGVQERYLLAVERRQSKIEEYNLLEKDESQEGLLNAPKNDINVTETKDNVAEISINVDNKYTKESKVKKSKVNMSSDSDLLTKEQFDDLARMSSSSVVDKYISKIINWQNDTGKNVRNPYETIKHFIQEDKKSQKSKVTKNKSNDNKTSYDLDEWEEFALNFNPNSAGGEKE